MSDFIREVDEEVRHDQFRHFWNTYWGFILLAVLVVLGGVGGWRFYSTYRQQQAEAAGARYLDALQEAATKPADALAALDNLAKDGPPGYALLARLRAAGETGRTDAAAGLKAFDAIAADPKVDPELQDVARIRAALLAVDSLNFAALQPRLEPLADANATFRNVAREMLAVAALKAGDDAAARRWLEAMAADPAAMPDQRQRVGLFLSLIPAAKPAAPVPVAAPKAPPAATPPAPPPAAVTPPAAAPTTAEPPAPAAPAPAAPQPAPAAPQPAPAPAATTPPPAEAPTAAEPKAPVVSPAPAAAAPLAPAPPAPVPSAPAPAPVPSAPAPPAPAPPAPVPAAPAPAPVPAAPAPSAPQP